MGTRSAGGAESIHLLVLLGAGRAPCPADCTSFAAWLCTKSTPRHPRWALAALGNLSARSCPQICNPQLPCQPGMPSRRPLCSERQDSWLLRDRPRPAKGETSGRSLSSPHRRRAAAGSCRIGAPPTPGWEKGSAQPSPHDPGLQKNLQAGARDRAMLCHPVGFHLRPVPPFSAPSLTLGPVPAPPSSVPASPPSLPSSNQLFPLREGQAHTGLQCARGAWEKGAERGCTGRRWSPSEPWVACHWSCSPPRRKEGRSLVLAAHRWARGTSKGALGPVSVSVLWREHG